MKQKISVSVDETLITKLDEKIQTGLFRNKSHMIEFALNKLLKEAQEELR